MGEWKDEKSDNIIRSLVEISMDRKPSNNNRNRFDCYLNNNHMDNRKMTPSEYRYHIEKTYVEITENHSFLLTDPQFQLFADMAKHCSKGSLVIDNWKIFLDGGGKSPEDYFEWWNQYKPYEREENEKAVAYNPGKKSPFDAVKKVVSIF